MTDTGPPRSCRHCGGKIERCPTPSSMCKGWLHARTAGDGRRLSHYCGLAAAGPVAEPGDRELAAIGMHEDGSGK